MYGIFVFILADDEISMRQGCNEGDLRLIGSDMANEGNLEVCHFDVWGSVCNTDWSEANSNVACRELGFTTGNLFQFPMLRIVN